ncbi:MAG: hypothetical protein QXM75_02435 [Candidatus Diapherotrites archaeon]
MLFKNQEKAKTIIKLGRIFLEVVIDITFYTVALALALASVVCLVYLIFRPNIIDAIFLLLGVAIYIIHLKKKKHKVPLSNRFFAIEIKGSEEFGNFILREFADFGASVGIVLSFLILITGLLNVFNINITDNGSVFLKLSYEAIRGDAVSVLFSIVFYRYLFYLASFVFGLVLFYVLFLLFIKVLKYIKPNEINGEVLVIGTLSAFVIFILALTCFFIFLIVAGYSEDLALKVAKTDAGVLISSLFLGLPIFGFYKIPFVGTFFHKDEQNIPFTILSQA